MVTPLKGVEAALCRKPWVRPSRCRILDGEKAAKGIAPCCGSAPSGHARRTLRLLAHEVGLTGNFHSASSNLAGNQPGPPGDQILLYTDGVSESMNMEHQMFGLPQVKLALQAAAGDLQSIISAVADRFDRFRNGRSPSDDTLILGFERLPP